MRDNRNLFNKGALQLVIGYTSGPTDPPHRWQVAYGSGSSRVTHADYNKEIAKQLDAYIRAKGISRTNKMTQAQSQAFVESMMNGKDALTGKTNNTLKTFNQGVMADARRAGHKGPFTLDAATARRQGIAYARTNNRAQIIMGRLAAAAVVFSLFEQGSKFASALDNVATNGHFVAAINAIEQGNLTAATRQLFGKDGDYINYDSVAKDLYQPFQGTLAGQGVQIFLDELFAFWNKRIQEEGKSVQELLDLVGKQAVGDD